MFELLQPRLLLSGESNAALIDRALPDYEALSAAVAGEAAVLLYDGSHETAEDVLSQVAAQADAFPLDSLSIFSHGSPGRFFLGRDEISAESLAADAAAWNRLGRRMAPGGNIYLFGCRVADDRGDGQALLDRLAELTGADVFASDDLTGAGGDWDLECASAGDEAELAAGLPLPLDAARLSQYASVPFALGNTPPVANDDSYTLDEDGILLTPDEVLGPGVLANDTDAEGDPLSAVLVDAPAYGQLEFGWDGSFLYTPDPNFAGVDTFTYLVNDSFADSNLAIVTLTVNAVNDAPAGIDTLVTTWENVPYTFTLEEFLLIDECDSPPNALLGVKILTLPAAGRLLLDGMAVSEEQTLDPADIAAGKLVYHPAYNANGLGYAEFVFQVQDDGGTENGGVDLATTPNTMFVDVMAVNAPPVVTTNWEEFEYPENNGPTLFNYEGMIDDDNPELVGVTVQIVRGYHPGEDVLSFTEQEGVTGSWDAATGVLKLSGMVPVGMYRLALQSIQYENTSEDPSTASRRIRILGNDGACGDFNGDGAIDAADIDLLTANLGEGNLGYDLNGDGTVGQADVDYLIQRSLKTQYGDANLDGIVADPDLDIIAAHRGLSGPGIGWAEGDMNGDGVVDDSDAQRAIEWYGFWNDDQCILIRVVAVNDAPAAADDTYGTDEDTPLTVTAPAGVLANDTDVENDALTAVLVSGPSHATAFHLNADGSFTYTPAANYNGDDAFTYKANDGDLFSDVATVHLTIDPVNDAPAAADDTYGTDEDTPLAVPAAGVFANDTDVENDALTAVLVSGPSHAAAFHLNADGSFTYTPAANYNGDDAFTYKAHDRDLDSGEATVTITVTPVNDPPVLAMNGEDDLIYTQHKAAVAIAPDLVAHDVDNNSLASAQVQIVANYCPDQDRLAFVDQGGIVGDWNVTTGALTLRGVATVAAYEAALHSIVYFNTARLPLAAARTIQVVVNDGAAESATVTVAVAVRPVPWQTWDEYVMFLAAESTDAAVRPQPVAPAEPAAPLPDTPPSTSAQAPAAGEAQREGCVQTAHQAAWGNGVWQAATGAMAPRPGSTTPALEAVAIGCRATEGGAPAGRLQAAVHGPLGGGREAPGLLALAPAQEQPSPAAMHRGAAAWQPSDASHRQPESFDTLGQARSMAELRTERVTDGTVASVIGACFVSHVIAGTKGSLALKLAKGIGHNIC